MGASGTGPAALAGEARLGERLLIVLGGDRIASSADGRRRYSGGTDLHLLLQPASADRLHLTRRLPRGRDLPDLSRYGRVVNLITDPDLNPRALANLRRLLDGYRGVVVNRPAAIAGSSRDRVAARLDGIPGLRVRRVARLAGRKPAVADRLVELGRLPLPAIVRRAGTHTGKIVALAHSLAELRTALGAAGDHFATEFVDCRGADGLYRKYRVFFFGDQVVFRHMIAFDQWSVHGSTRLRFMVHRPDLLAEEQRLCARPEGPFPASWQEVFRSVAERMDLDFFGLDFGVGRDGQLVLFEANATMNFFPPVADPRFHYLSLPLPAGRAAFQRLVTGREPDE